MRPAPEKRSLPRARRARRIAGRLALLIGVVFAGAGCVIIPVPSVTPDYRVGIVDDDTLESLVGLDQEEVNERIGYPDYSGRRDGSYVMVYQGETRHSTDVYVFVSAGYTGGGGKVDEGTSKNLHCQVLELDADRIVQDYDVIVRPYTGITRRADSGYVVEPATDCSKVVWGQDVQVGDSPGQVEATKRIMREQEEREARRIANLEARARKAELEHHARQGDVQAAIELLDMTENRAPLEALAEGGDVDAAVALAELEGDFSILEQHADGGDRRAAYATYRILSRNRETIVDAWEYLCSAANAGDPRAQAEVGYWHRQAVFERALLDKLAWTQQHVGIRADNRIAYAWYTLAASSGNAQATNAREHYVASNMTPQEIAEAQRMAADWKPGDCPSADNRLPAPGET